MARGDCLSVGLFMVNQLQQIADGAVGFDGVSQVLAREHLIAILPPDPLSSDVPLVLQVLDDALDSAFGNPNHYGNLS